MKADFFEKLRTEMPNVTFYSGTVRKIEKNRNFITRMFLGVPEKIADLFHDLHGSTRKICFLDDMGRQ